ncbi:hypothetical protein FA95DRAFT_884403 [Auriscalpium vulgare]|uniref:Uncharacterized protein n=1 Tax=Auriscalpium vulgare TaxID=40419 RepID=A0ACB8R8C5_9AGAM|nr:hypothetical protein FA95DRAFT_884403 [Auriscalpium vulgare]
MANYLPLLLVSVTTNAVPDDTSLSTQARGQVDYLSHEWREEDVWRSWRNMTRQKNEIANGMRLENASWRTWWKQRNKLKTISPETLNWLKDSDVTWLYGPLHTALDWSPPPKPKADPTSVEKDHSAHDRLGLSTDCHPSHQPSKPILKHRSISDLLTSALPSLANADDDEEDDEEDDDDELAAPTRPMLLHTKSDTHITRWARNHPYRKDSPPRIIAPVSQTAAQEANVTPEPSDLAMAPALAERSGSSDSARDTNGSSQDLSIAAGGGKKKHISFNTFVEQCIAIDSPPKQKRGSLPSEPRGLYEEVIYDEGYDEDSEAEAEFNEADDIIDEGGLFSEGQNGSDSDEEDDDILEMRTSSTRSRSSSSSRSPGVSATYTRRSQPPSSYNPRPPLIRTSSSDKEHMTIAPIAPTILKTTGVGNHFVVPHFGRGRGSRDTPSQPISLVYVPPIGSGYRRGSSGSANGTSSSEDVYRHREARFTVGATSPSLDASPSGSRSPTSRSAPATAQAIANSLAGAAVQAQPLPIPGPEHYGHVPYGAGPARVLSPPMVESPMGAHEDGFDYFGAAAMVNAHPIIAAERVANAPDADIGVDMMHAPDSILEGHGRVSARGMGAQTRSGGMPEVVVNDENGAIEERREVELSPSRSRSRTRSRSRSKSHSRSHSRTPSPAELMIFDQDSARTHNPSSSISVPVSRTSSSHSVTSPTFDPSLLSPPTEHLPTRGRTPTVVVAASPSISAAAISGSVSPRERSYSRDREDRGRSVTRTSSFSDRERSASRSSVVGSGSPLGSVSPTASSLGLGGGAYAVYTQGRGREGGLARGRKGSVESLGSAVRGRVGRRPSASESSVSPSSPTLPEGRSLDSIAAALPPPSPSTSFSAPSTTIPRSPSIPNEPPPSSSRLSKPALPKIPTSIKEEDEPSRSVASSIPSTPVDASPAVQAAPSPPTALRRSSPKDMIRPPALAPPTSATSHVHAEPPAKQTHSAIKAGNPAAVPLPTSPTSPTDESSGLVGRAADLVSTARGFLGAFWPSHNSHPSSHAA